MTFLSDEYFMLEALKLAEDASQRGEIPVGAVVVCKNRIIAKGSNQTEQLHDVTAHAEMIALTAAAQHLKAKYLRNCTLYVSLEPCVMCAGAIFWSQIGRLVYAASDEKRGFSLLEKAILHPKTQITKGILATESQALLSKFFHKLRT